MVGFPSDHEEEVYRLVKMYSELLIETSRIKMQLSLSVFFFNKKSFFSKESSKDTTRILFFCEKRKLDL